MPDSLQPHGLQPAKAPLSMEFPRQQYESGLPFPSPGDLPSPGTEPRSPSLQADTFPSEPPGKTANQRLISFLGDDQGLTRKQTDPEPGCFSGTGGHLVSVFVSMTMLCI